MQNGALRRVGELSADARPAMEGLLGRPLRDDEAITVNVYKPAPTGAARETKLSGDCWNVSIKPLKKCKVFPNRKSMPPLTKQWSHHP